MKALLSIFLLFVGIISVQAQNFLRDKFSTKGSVARILNSEDGDVFTGFAFSDSIGFLGYEFINKMPNSENGFINNSDLALIYSDSVGNIKWFRQVKRGKNFNSLLELDINRNEAVAILSGDGLDTIYIDNELIYFPPEEFPTWGQRVFHVLKFDEQGNTVWQTNIADEQTNISKIKMDDAGDVYIYGGYMGRLQVGDTVLYEYDPITHAQRIFLIKLSGEDGHFMWAKTWGGPGFNRAEGICFGENNQIYVTGSFYTELVFGENIIKANDSYGEGFIVNLTSNGDFVWGNTVYGSNNASFFQADYKDGYLLASGWILKGTAQMDEFELSTNEVAWFITKVDTSNGAFEWVKQTGETEYLDINNVKVIDPQQYVFSGWYEGGVFSLAEFKDPSNKFSETRDVFFGIVQSDHTLQELHFIKNEKDVVTRRQAMSGNNHVVLILETLADSLNLSDTVVYRPENHPPTVYYYTLTSFRIPTAVNVNEPQYVYHQYLNTHPNPVAVSTTINIPCQEEEYQLQISNTQGKLVHAEAVKGCQSFELNMSEWKQGVYILRLSNGNIHYQNSIIKK